MAWTDEIARTQAELVYYLRIEGYPVWFFTRTPDASWAAPAGVTFRDGLAIPATMEQSVKLFDGRATAGHLEFRIKDILTTPSASPSAANPYFLTRAFATGRSLADSNVYSAYLTADLTPTAVSATVTTVAGLPAMPFDLYIGIETVRVTANPAGTTLTITRAAYPSVDGGGLGLRHDFDANEEGAPLVLVSSVPFSWVNRRVALHATWYDRASQTFGAQADSQVIWRGRLARLDFDVPTDEWRLSCKPLLEDLQRPIMATVRPTTIRGIQLTGVPTVLRIIGLQFTNVTSGATTLLSVTVPGNLYDDYADLEDEINAALAALAAPVGVALTQGSFVFFNYTGADEYRVMVQLPAPLAVTLGYTEDYSAWARPVVSVPAATSARIDPPQAPARVYHPADATEIAASTNAVSQYFVTGAPPRQQAGAGVSAVAPAVLLDGKMALRYNAFVETGLLTDVRSSGWPGEGAPSNLRLRRGPDYVLRRSGGDDNQEQIPAAQAYVSPRGFGFPLNGIIRELLKLMTSTGYAVNGTYDVLPVGYGLGIPAALIDTASFEAVEDELGAASAERQWIVSEPTPLSDLIDAEAKTLGFYVVMNGSGQLAARRIAQDFAGLTAVALTEDNKHSPTDRATFSVSPASLLNQVTVRFDYQWQDDKPASELPFNWRVSQQQYETTRGLDVDNRGLYSFESMDTAELIGRLQERIGVYADPWPTVTRTINRQLFTRIVPGDRLRLTDSGLPDVFTGNRGVAAMTVTAVRVSFDLHKGHGRVDAIHDGMIPDAQRAPLDPSARLTAFNPGTFVATLAANDFSVAPATDVDSFAVGDVVLIVEGSATTPTASTNTQRTIAAVGANQVTLDGAIGGLDPAVSVVYLTFARHDSTVTGQRTRGTWMGARTDNLIQNATRIRHYM